MTEPTHAMVLLSGGMDSTVLLHEVVETLGCSPVAAVAFHYGQKHAKELDCAETQANLLNVDSFEIIDISFVGAMVAPGTSLVEGGATVPDLEELDESNLDQPPTYVPNRNMLLLSLSAAYAEARNIRDLYYGAQAHDEYGYWDCTEEFLSRINAVLALNRRDSIKVHAPFVRAKKHELVTKGLELGVDFAKTWSCYRGGATPCMTCPTCIERATAFRDAGVTDPLLE